MTLKNELQNIIIGNEQVRFGENIQATLAYLRTKKKTISGIEKTKYFKKQGPEFLIEYINNQIPEVLLINISIIYFNWMERLEKLETPINFSLSFSYIISILSCA